MTTLEEQVQNYLKTNGISQKFFANLIGISSANAGAMFRNKRKMKATELITFCKHFNLGISDFNLEGSND